MAIIKKEISVQLITSRLGNTFIERVKEALNDTGREILDIKYSTSCKEPSNDIVYTALILYTKES